MRTQGMPQMSTYIFCREDAERDARLDVQVASVVTSSAAPYLGLDHVIA